jgi:Cft2 family RNA processing exonuclease
MKITFLGGADEVGASCSFIEIAGKKLLVDAGIRISPKTSRGIDNDQLPDLQPISAAGGPDYILLTHAHTDHTGALALVMEQYPFTPVIMTRPTEALVRVLQKDALNIMKSRSEEEGEMPLYDEVSVNRLLDAVQLVEFKQPLKLAEGLQVTYHVAGHIAGAAMLVLESTEGTLVMSGDVSVSPQRTVKAVEVPRIKADALVLESTYGGRLHANRVAEEKRLIQTLARVNERGGKVLIPAFALGRSQELIQIIHAFSDQVNVPVYVDGMVRSVCDAYTRFADLLPEATVRAAGDEHLFFRGRVKPIRNAEQRSHIAMGTEPCVIIASSGMLTGGASAYYAKYLAPDERNGIFLTGYQDEESPGRVLQRWMREKEKGEVPTLKLGKDEVKLRCEVDTYSLSAHADESELVGIAEAFGAQDIMLVHGDEGARHSLATGLRQRQKIVVTPRIGTERILNYTAKPWAVGVAKGQHKGSVDLMKLWESLKAQAGSYFSSRELAQVWWGEGDRAEEMQERLKQYDNVYLSPDWRNRSTFLVRTEPQVKRALRQRAIMLANPDIVGKLIVFRNTNNQPRLGIVTTADSDSFDAIASNTKGTHFPADALLWVIGRWEKPEGMEGSSTKTILSEMLKDARAFMDVIIPIEMRRHLVENELTVLPESLLPEELPETIDQQTALISVVLALATDGATLEQDGLKPTRARDTGPLEQNEVRELAYGIFPEAAGLRKVGMDIHRVRLMLYFDFPQAAERLYSEEIEELTEKSGWDVKVMPQVNQQALSLALDKLLPEGARISKGPSYYMEKREVQAEIVGASAEALDTMKREFMRNTDFKFVATEKKDVQIGDMTVLATGEQMEMNQAYAVLRHALEPLGMYKSGFKSGYIVLSWVSPQIAERYKEQIQELSKQTGYVLKINPQPNQQRILEYARKLASNAGWTVTRGPSIFIDRAKVELRLVQPPDLEQAAQIMADFEQQTGYKLDVS